ncbi:hypothetical protein Ddc_19592 [Ditylenchus destructor]|nr:hypothetical protein Ddc_19592 [Ditylenchus destructor]
MVKQSQSFCTSRFAPQMQRAEQSVYVVAGDYAVCYTTGFFNDLFQDAPIFTMLTFKTWFFFYFLAVCSPAVQFLYRYLVLCRDWTPSYRLYIALLSTVMLIILTYSLMTSLAGVEVYVSRSSNTLYREFILTPNPLNVDLIVMKALLPIIGLLLPVCIDVFGSVLRADIAGMPFIFQFATLWIMNANPLFTILLIESYRRTILGCCFTNSRTTAKVNVAAVNDNAAP